MSAASVFVGVMLLVLGRRLFWVFLAGTGFLLGAWLSVEFLHQQPEAVRLGAAVVLGLAGVALAFMAQKVAVGIGGFLAGIILGQALAGVYPFGGPPWLPPLVGGVVGIFLLAAVFNWALIAFSSLLGAAVITQNAAVAQPWPPVLFGLLLAVGLVVQTRQYKGRKKSDSKKSE